MADAQNVTDAAGRVLEVKLLSVLERRRLIRAWGPAADIDRWVGEAMIAAHVRSIDGVPLPMPTTADAADILVDRVGPAGLNAVVEWVPGAAAAAAIDQAAAKN